jgi:hypothetical protein
VRARNRLNRFYWTRVYPALPLNNVQFEQLTDFKLPQRMFLATMAVLDEPEPMAYSRISQPSALHPQPSACSLPT